MDADLLRRPRSFLPRDGAAQDFDDGTIDASSGVCRFATGFSLTVLVRLCLVDGVLRNKLLDVRARRKDLQSLVPGLIERFTHHDGGKPAPTKLRIGHRVVEITDAGMVRVLGQNRRVRRRLGSRNAFPRDCAPLSRSSSGSVSKGRPVAPRRVCVLWSTLPGRPSAISVADVGSVT